MLRGGPALAKRAKVFTKKKLIVFAVVCTIFRCRRILDFLDPSEELRKELACGDDITGQGDGCLGT